MFWLWISLGFLVGAVIGYIIAMIQFGRGMAEGIARGLGW